MFFIWLLVKHWKTSDSFLTANECSENTKWNEKKTSFLLQQHIYIIGVLKANRRVHRFCNLLFNEFSYHVLNIYRYINDLSSYVGIDSQCSMIASGGTALTPNPLSPSHKSKLGTRSDYIVGYDLTSTSSLATPWPHDLAYCIYHACCVWSRHWTYAEPVCAG